MDLEGIILSEMSDKVGQILYIFTYMWNLKNKQMDSYNKNKNIFIDTENKLVVTRGEGERDKIGEGN